MSDNSYSLPPLAGQTASVSHGSNGQISPTTTNVGTQVNVPSFDVSRPTTKEYIFGGAILLVLAILFFFAAQQFSNHLVKKRYKPSTANNAAIWLFFVLFDISVIVVIGIFDAGILSLLQVSIPLAVLAMVFLILLFISLSRPRR